MTAYNASLDRFASVNTDPLYPARRAFVVTPSDTLDLTDPGQPAGQQTPSYAKALYVPVAGTVKVTMAGDVAEPSTPITFATVPAGIFEIQVRRVWTGSVAGIIALTD
jgi:hypothetical protein